MFRPKRRAFVQRITQGIEDTSQGFGTHRQLRQSLQPDDTITFADASAAGQQHGAQFADAQIEGDAEGAGIECQ